jgi:hypothetical protein
MSEDHVVVKDTGYKSRKLVVVLIGMGLIFLGGLLAAKVVGFATAYETFVGGIIGMGAMYVVGNVGNAFLSGKVNASVKVAQIASKEVERKEDGE